jgi:2-haloacid dehalogenase/putative hydrolase of the HAD superfamily
VFDTIFFDFYGTLVTGDRDAVEQTCSCVVEDLGLQMSATELATAWGHRFFKAIEHANGEAFCTLFELEVETLKQTLGDRTNGADLSKYASLLKSYWQRPKLAPHVHETLASIDVPVCVVSNADTEDVWHAIEFHALKIVEVVTSEDTRSYKPHRAIFQHALEKMKVRPDRVLHVGDSLHSDIGGAHQLGIAACWIDRTDRIMDIGKVEDVPISHKISCISELGGILSALC